MGTSYLKLPGVFGDATDSKHVGWIELRSLSISISAKIERPAGSDKASLKDERSTATLTRFRSDSSPQLRPAQNFDALTIETVGSDARKTTTLENATIERISQRTISDGVNKLWGEELTFRFERLREAASERAPAGNSGTPRPAPRPGKSFLQVPGISGDAKDAKHPGWIQLLGLDDVQAEPAKTTVDQTGQQREPVIVPASDPQDGQVTVSKNADSATQKLQDALLNQTQFPSITIEVITDAVTQKITLEKVLIIEFSTSKTDPSTERVTFAYERRATTQPSQPATKAAAFTAGPSDTRGDSDGQPQVSTFGSRGPVGTGEHIVKEGECISSIAKDTGHFSQTLWDEPANTELRDVRKDRNILLPGDRVHIPALREKWESGSSEQRHRFRRKGQPEVLRIRVLRDGDPRGNEPFTLDVDGSQSKGTTDADGNVAMPIAGDAQRAKLSVGHDDDVEEYNFHLGALDPLDELSGIQGRLNNLGFDCGPVDGKWGPHTEQAVKLYQTRRKLPVTGRPDDATRQKLREDYGS